MYVYKYSTHAHDHVAVNKATRQSDSIYVRTNQKLDNQVVFTYVPIKNLSDPFNCIHVCTRRQRLRAKKRLARGKCTVSAHTAAPPSCQTAASIICSACVRTHCTSGVTECKPACKSTASRQTPFYSTFYYAGLFSTCGAKSCRNLRCNGASCAASV